MTNYVAFLRGVNVGGKSLLKMADLTLALSEAGFAEVKTYIQSGNIIFTAEESNTNQLAEKIKLTIQNRFGLSVEVVVISKARWQAVIDSAPKWWGKDKAQKHNILILIPPFNMGEVINAIGDLKPEIEVVKAGEGVVYQSLSLEMFGRATSGKLASKPVYKRMTIRNYNTATKLLSLLAE